MLRVPCGKPAPRVRNAPARRLFLTGSPRSRRSLLPLGRALAGEGGESWADLAGVGSQRRRRVPGQTGGSGSELLLPRGLSVVLYPWAVFNSSAALLWPST